MRMRILLAGALVSSVVTLVRAEEEPAVRVTPDVVFGHKFGLALTMDVLTPQQNANRAGVMYIVSGGWHSGWFPPETVKTLFKGLLDEGFTVFVVRHGSSPKFDLPEIMEDVRRSVRFVRGDAERFGIEPDRIGVFGGSAGGHLALMLGTTADEGNPQATDAIERHSNRVAAVVALYPPTDIRPWVSDRESSYNKNFPALRFAAERAGDYSPRLHVTEDDAPALLLHGDRDQLVPLEHSEKILEALEQQGVPSKLIVIEGAGHGFSNDDKRRASDAMVAWFKEHLLKSSDGGG